MMPPPPTPSPTPGLESQTCHLFHFSICSLCSAPVFFLFCFWPVLLQTFQKRLLNLFLEIGFFVWPFGTLLVFFKKKLRLGDDT